jgi:3-keto-disaccharide hydrolase
VKYFVLITLAAFLVAADAPSAPQDFAPIFNGKDLAGWKIPDGDNGHWKVVDGVIDYDAQSEAKKEKHLWTEKEYGDFVLRVEWRFKETPFTNPRVKYVLPDGTNAKAPDGTELNLALPDSDSGIILRGDMKNQVNIWCWPIGSGEFYGWRTAKDSSPEIKAAVTPIHQADKPVGEWNAYEITMKGDRVTVVLNGTKVIDNAQLPGVKPRGALGLQHHGSMKDGKWTSPPALVQFRNLSIKEL